MSTLDIHRRALEREHGRVASYRKDAARISERIDRKQRELSRAKTPSQTQRLNREIQHLSEQKSDADRNAARYEAKSADLVRKIRVGEQEDQKKAKRMWEAAERKLARENARITQALADQSGKISGLQDRMTGVEDQIFDQVRDAVATDAVVRRYDVFLSYATPDKADARELDDELTALGLEVWFADRDAELGKSVTNQISDGIANSDIGVILITPEYIKGRPWTDREAGALISANRRVIPVIYGIDHDHLSQTKPILGDLGGVDAGKYGFEAVAQRIAATLEAAKTQSLEAEGEDEIQDAAI